MSSLYLSSTRNKQPRYDLTSEGTNSNYSAWTASYAASVKRGQKSSYAQENAWYAQPPFNVRDLKGGQWFQPPTCQASGGQCFKCNSQPTPFSGGQMVTATELFSHAYPSQRPSYITQCQAGCRMQLNEAMRLNPESSQANVLGYTGCCDYCRGTQ